jgi:hypothetical protein
MKRYEPVELSRTDFRKVIGLLAACAVLIDKYSRIAREADKARQARQLLKKLKKKTNYDSNH